MRLIFLLIATCITASYAAAATYSGKISISQKYIVFTDSQEQKDYIVKSATPLIAAHINKLSDGDFISFDGTKNYTDRSVIISSFNYVGLKGLVGTWFGDDDYCYTFHTFTEFSISRKFGDACLTPSRPNYTYVLSPTSNSWVIIISATHGGNYLGEIHFYGQSDVGFYLYDPESGDILRSIRLRK